MKFPPWLRVYGDMSYRGECPVEAVEQATFFNRIRAQYPTTWGRTALHPRNEQRVRGGQFQHLARQKAEGQTKGAADILIPAGPPVGAFVCELKRRDPTRSRWEDGQLEYLEAAQHGGSFVCVALGVDAAWDAFTEWAQAQAGG